MRLVALLLLLGLTACQPFSPVQPTPLSSAASRAEPAPVAASAPVRALAPTWTAVPTLTSTPLPTSTLTPIPTLTPLPTSTSTSAPVAEAVMLIDRPLPNEFVPSTVSVAGSVTHAAGGVVIVQVRAPDGQAVDVEPVVAITTPNGDGITFTAEVPLELPPTPRLALVHAAWSDAEQGRTAEATQPINVLGRYPRVDRLLIEAPAPFTRGAEATIMVRGVAPGPPVKILARLLDDADQVLESIEAQLLWHQPGLPCSFAAVLSNNPAATQLQIITLGPDDAVIEAARVRLEPRR